jgi:hypothetical protein
MLFNYISCSLLFVNWLQDHLLPCPFKYLTGIDCPGCGFQRAVIALFKGNFQQSFYLYPPAIPVILTCLWWLADGWLKLDTKKATVKKSLFMITGSFILVSYMVKIFMAYIR